MAAITEYTKKKLVEYLYDGANVLILFGHGLGDTVMFYPVFEALKSAYPKVKFDLYVECGQEEVFGKVKREEEKYDLVFSINYPMSEHLTDKTKSEYCCIQEIGIDPVLINREFSKLPLCKSPLIALHFNSTALPGSVNCPSEVAEQLWLQVVSAGFVPIECHYQHVFHNPVNKKYDFVNNTVRGCKASIPALIGLLQRCRGFIGVASGPLTIALSMYPERTLYLENSHRLSTYTRDKRVGVISTRGTYDSDYVARWLDGLREG
jgi:hypothetical protein